MELESIGCINKADGKLITIGTSSGSDVSRKIWEIWRLLDLNTDTDLRFILSDSSSFEFACLVRRNGKLIFLSDERGNIMQLNRTLYDTLCNKLRAITDSSNPKPGRPFESIIRWKSNYVDLQAEPPKSSDECDVRMTFLPSEGYDALHIRVLNRNIFNRPLSQIILVDSFRNRLMEEFSKLYDGLCLICGPTGHGKTTTYYALLDAFASLDMSSANSVAEPVVGGRVVISLEDPIEHLRSRLTQVRVNRWPGFSFGEGLREALRHDPDVIAFGEIRDDESAKWAVVAASTGHLVLGTIHCWSLREITPRLKMLHVVENDANISVKLAINQRLVPRHCPACRLPDTSEEVKQFAVIARQYAEKYGVTIPTHQPCRTTGCNECNKTGILGRIPVFEMMNESELSGKETASQGSENVDLTLFPNYSPMNAYSAALFLMGEISYLEAKNLFAQFDDSQSWS